MAFLFPSQVQNFGAEEDPALREVSNVEQQERPAKRQNTGGAGATTEDFDDLVSDAGVVNLTSPDGEHLHVEDPRAMRRHLELKLVANTELRGRFLAGLEQALQEHAVLRRALLPMSVLSPSAYATGDSFLRVVLNIPCLQAQVCSLLLEKLAEYSSEECSSPSSTPSLILGQMRWLEGVVDSAALTDKVLEVLEACPPQIQREIVGFLPEVAPEGEQPRVLEALKSLLEQDLGFLPAVLEAAANMHLDRDLQEEMTAFVQSQLPAVPCEELPLLLRYLLQNATSSDAPGVISALRSSLHFVEPSDPRLAVPDLRQKGPAHAAGDTCEARVVRELQVALQVADAAADAALKAVAALAEPSQHLTLDLWLLLILHGRSDSSRKAVEGLLRKKLLEGRAQLAWLDKGLARHQGALREVWPALLALAQRLARCREAPLAGAGAHLYKLLFVHFEQSCSRQEVLHSLHIHLGSGSPEEADAVLAALGALSSCHAPSLAAYGGYLANILDYLEAFSDGQLKKVFTIFAQLTGPEAQPAAAQAAGTQPAAQAAAGSSSAGGSGGSSSSGRRQAGGRLDDELHITINKAVAHSSASYKRIGIIGTMALLRQLGATYVQVNPASDAGGKLAADWFRSVDYVLLQCRASPPCFAFLLDQLSSLVSEPLPCPPGSEAKLLPLNFTEHLHTKVSELVEGTFLGDIAQDEQGRQQPLPPVSLPGGLQVQPQLWLNLDGELAPVCLSLLPMLVSEDPGERACLTWLGAAFRLFSCLEMAMMQELTNIDALLGCPIAMFPDDLIQDLDKFADLPAATREVLLAALQHLASWLREVVNAFTGQMQVTGIVAAAATQVTQQASRLSILQDTQAKVLARVTQLQQLDCLVQELLQDMPPGTSLQDLARPLGTAGAMTAAAAALAAGPGAAAAAKPPAGLKLEDVRRRMRPLLLSSAQALAIDPGAARRPNALLMAQHLLADLQPKVVHLLGKAARPSFLATAQPAQVPPGLEGVSGGQLLELLQPLLPAWRQLVDCAVECLRDPPEDGTAALLDGVLGQNVASDVLGQSPLVLGHLELGKVASQVLAGSWDCWALLLTGCAGKPEQRRLVLRHLLPALAAGSGGEQGLAPISGQPSQEQVMALGTAAFKYLSQLTCCAAAGGSGGSLQLELSLLRLQKALLAALEGLAGLKQGGAAGTQAGAGAAEKLAALRGKLSRAAGAALEDEWLVQQEVVAGEAQPAEPAKAPFSWKGQGAAISELLALHVSCAEEPLATLLHLASEALPQVPAKAAKGQQLAARGGFAALSCSTLTVWFKALLELAVAQWEGLVARVGKAGAGLEEEQEAGVLADAYQAAQVYAQLMSLTKAHGSKVALLGQAVKLGGKLLATCLKMAPFLKQRFGSQQEDVLAVVRKMQGGNKLLQVLCAESKALRTGAISRSVPATKQALERFLFSMKQMFHEGDYGEAFWMGNLKHRDLRGNTVASQMFPEEEEQEEEEEGEEEEEQEGGDGDGDSRQESAAGEDD